MKRLLAALMLTTLTLSPLAVQAATTNQACLNKSVNQLKKYKEKDLAKLLKTTCVTITYGGEPLGNYTPGQGNPTPDTPTDDTSHNTPVGTAQKPSDVLDLTNWYLGLPTGKQGSPDNVYQPKLNTYDNPPVFTLNSNKDGVQFRARVDGVHTKNSQYPRSELREMTDNGTKQAAWDGTHGTHTMELTEAITHLPVKKPEVVAGQIHGKSDDLFLIHLSGTNLRVKYNDTSYAEIDPHYQLGTKFTIKLETKDGISRVWYNGQLKFEKQLADSGSYFKAGCYTQSNTSKGDAPDAYGEVVIFNLTVRHQ